MNRQKQEQLKKLMEEHPEINDKLKELNAANQKEMLSNVIKLMNKYGMELTAEDFKAPQGEISDDELEAVVGGGLCTCAFYGEGEGDYLDCWCPVGGAGYINYGKPVSDSYGGCLCAIAGAGATNWGDDHPDRTLE